MKDGTNTNLWPPHAHSMFGSSAPPPTHACSHLNMYTHMHSHMQAHTQRGEDFILFLCVCLSMSVSRHVCHSVHLEVRG